MKADLKLAKKGQAKDGKKLNSEAIEARIDKKKVQIQKTEINAAVGAVALLEGFFGLVLHYWSGEGVAPACWPSGLLGIGYRT